MDRLPPVPQDEVSEPITAMISDSGMLGIMDSQQHVGGGFLGLRPHASLAPTDGT